jgi:hypothetical protein
MKTKRSNAGVATARLPAAPRRTAAPRRPAATAETAPQYVRRLLGLLGNREPLGVMEQTPRSLAALFRDVSKPRLLARPAPGKWSALEILSHMAEMEMVYAFRVRQVLTRSGQPIQALDQNDWARVGNYRKLDLDRSLALFTLLRAANLTLLRSIPRSAWKRYGLHEERGREELGLMARLLAGHDLNHLAQLERILPRRRAS